jgi:curved DNA-binding protein CbpA
VPQNADDGCIRQAYLNAIKTATPDTHPEQFKEIQAAYDKIKDEPSRIRFILFDNTAPGNSPFDAYVRYARQFIKPAPLPFEAMKEYLRSCSKI